MDISPFEIVATRHLVAVALRLGWSFVYVQWCTSVRRVTLSVKASLRHCNVSDAHTPKHNSLSRLPHRWSAPIVHRNGCSTCIEKGWVKRAG